MAQMLREDGITILLDSPVAEVRLRRIGDAVADAAAAGVAVHVGGESPQVVEGSHLLVATGRQPNTEALDLAAAGIEVDEHGYIPVNDRLETAVAGIWALGDVKGGPAFTHISYDDYRVVRGNLLGGGGFSTAGRLVPYVVFTDPQLGRVGLTETEARKRGLDVRVAKLPMDWVARALETGESRGFMKAVVDAETGLHPRRRGAGGRRRRSHGPDRDGHARGRHGRATSRRRLRAPHPGRGAQQPLRLSGAAVAGARLSAPMLCVRSDTSIGREGPAHRALRPARPGLLGARPRPDSAPVRRTVVRGVPPPPAGPTPCRPGGRAGRPRSR